MNQNDKEFLRANFKALRKYGYAEIHQYIIGYIRALEAHELINGKVRMKINMIADDMLNDYLPFK